MDITNKQIYDKLIEIENLIRKLQVEEDRIFSTEKSLDKCEKEELVLLAKLSETKSEKLYPDFYQWKDSIWDHCDEKMEIETKDGFDYDCKKVGNKCRFVDCYKNRP